jgi:hypothetical protein
VDSVSGAEQVRLPLAPERAHLQLVDRRRVAVHAARDVGVVVRGRLEALLARLQRLDVVGRREPARPEEEVEVLQAPAQPLGALLARRERVAAQLHVVGAYRRDRPDRQARDVQQQQVRIDQQVAAGLGHPVGPLGAVALLELVADRLDLRLGVLAEDRVPAGDRARERRRVVDDGVAVAEVVAARVLRAQRLRAVVVALAGQEREVRVVQRRAVVAVDAVLHHQLPVRVAGVAMRAR